MARVAADSSIGSQKNRQKTSATLGVFWGCSAIVVAIPTLTPSRKIRAGGDSLCSWPGGRSNS